MAEIASLENTIFDISSTIRLPNNDKIEATSD